MSVWEDSDLSFPWAGNTKFCIRVVSRAGEWRPGHDLPESASDSDESLEKKSEKVKTTRGKKSTSEDLKYSELDDEDRDFKRDRKEEDIEGKPAISPITFPSTNATGLLKRKRTIEEGYTIPSEYQLVCPYALYYLWFHPVHMLSYSDDTSM